jgi:predicted nucleotidyltransferase
MVQKEQDIDLAQVRKFLQDKETRRRQQLAERLNHAQEDARRIIDHIARRYAPRRIYQWGSLLETRDFSEISDIDIGVEGLTGPEQYFAMLGDAMRMTIFPVDLVEMEKVDQETAESLRRRGRLVYERQT